MSIFKEPSLNELIRKNPPHSGYTVKRVGTKNKSDGENFYSTTHTFDLQMKPDEFVLPDKSHMRLRVKLRDNGGNALELSDDISFVMNPTSTLFEQTLIEVNDKKVDEVQNNYSIIDTVLKRLKKRANRESKEQYFDANFGDRQIKTVGDRESPYSSFKTCKSIISVSSLNSAIVNCTIAVGALQKRQISLTTGAGAPLASTIKKYLKIGDPIRLTNANGNYNGYIVEYDVATNILYGSDDGGLVIGDGAITFSEITKNIYNPYFIKVEGQVGVYDLIYYPEMSWFYLPSWNSGTSKISFKFTTKTKAYVMRDLIESMASSKSEGLTNDFLFEVLDMRMFFFKIKSEVEQTRTKYFDRTNYKLRPEQIKKSDLDRTISLDGNLSGIVLFFAQTNSSTLTSPNRFEVDYTGAVPNVKSENQIYKHLEELQVTFEHDFPETRYQFRGETNNDDSMYRLYLDNNSNLGNTLEMNETYSQFIERGIYLYVPLNGQGKENKDVELKFKFNTAMPIEATVGFNLYVLSMHRELKQLDIVDWVVKKVSNIDL